MTDLITIFIDGGEYVNRAAYIEQRDEASKLRERIEQLEKVMAEQSLRLAWVRRGEPIGDYEFRLDIANKLDEALEGRE